MAGPNRTRAHRRASKRALPVERIPWGRRLGVTTLAVTAACTAAADAAPQRPTLDPTLQCDVHTVAAGDWMSKIALRNGLTAQELIARNPHIPDPNRIWPGDQVVLRCIPRAPKIAPTATAAPATTTTVTAPAAPALEVNAMQAAPKPPPTVDWPGANPFIPGEQIVDGVVSQGLILRALYNAGARGNQLILLASVTEGESNRRMDRPENRGDIELQDATYGPSVGPWQIRTEKKATGTGSLVDIDVAVTLEGGAAAAVAKFDASLARGRDGMYPWYNTVFVKKNHLSFIGPYTELAQKMGLLDGGAR